MLLDMFYRHVVTLFIILLFAVKLWPRKNFRNTETKYFWLTLISCLLLVAQDTLETMAAGDPSLRVFRIALSVLGYTLRSVAVLGLLLVVMPREKRSFLLWIPSLLTLAVCGTAFFTDAAFGFDENYGFYRGPLGYVAFAVPILYMLLILSVTFRHFSERKGIEKYVVPVGALFCLTASVIDALHGGVRLNEAILVSSVFFYIFLYSHDNRRDQLTGLLNRQSLYDDCIQFGKRVGAVASLDMNGLKELNDSLGHFAGDKALKTIGAHMLAAMDPLSSAYRIGGDEFLILFFHSDAEKTARVVAQIKQAAADDGYSLSAGLALRTPGMELEETINESDRLMYEEKDRYYAAVESAP